MTAQLRRVVSSHAFDAVILVVIVANAVVVSLAFVPGIRESSTLLRLARLLRIVRIFRVLPDLRILVVGVVRSLPPLSA